jgi:hypothetical protein
METRIVPVEKLEDVKRNLLELNEKYAETHRLYKLAAEEVYKRHEEITELISLTERAKTHLSARRSLFRRLKALINK